MRLAVSGFDGERGAYDTGTKPLRWPLIRPTDFKCAGGARVLARLLAQLPERNRHHGSQFMFKKRLGQVADRGCQCGTGEAVAVICKST